MFHCPPALQEKYDEPEKHVKLQSINHNAIGKDFGLYGDRLGDLMDPLNKKQRCQLNPLTPHVCGSVTDSLVFTKVKIVQQEI